MDLELSADQQELHRSVRDVLDRECPTSVARELVEKGTRPDALWSHIVSLGWPALALPESVGGIGLGTVELAVVVEEMGRHLAPGPFLATATQYAPLLLAAAPTPERDALLAEVAEGVTGTVAITEHADQWRYDDIAATPTGATKHQVLDAASAQRVAVLLRDNQVAVLDAGGVQVTSHSAVDGTRPFGSVTFSGTAERVLDVDAGALDRAMDVATLAIALDTVGVCQTILDTVLDYAKSRQQFGVPIGSFQAVKHKASDMFVALERARATAYAAALAVEESGADERALAVSMAKAAAGDAQLLIAQDGIQLMGGIGYTWEHDMHLFAKRAKSGATLFGSARHHRQRIADLIGLKT